MGLLKQKRSLDLRASEIKLGSRHNPDQGPFLDQLFSLEKNWLGQAGHVGEKHAMEECPRGTL